MVYDLFKFLKLRYFLYYFIEFRWIVDPIPMLLDGEIIRLTSSCLQQFLVSIANYKYVYTNVSVGNIYCHNYPVIGVACGIYIYIYRVKFI